MCDVTPGVVDVRLQEHAVARRLVHLDIVVARQKRLKLSAVESRIAANQRHARGIEAEFVVPHAPHRVAPIRTGREIVDEPALPVFSWNHFVGAEHMKIFGDKGVAAHLSTNVERDLDRVQYKAVSLQLHLATRYIQTRDDLLVRTRRSVREDS